MSAAVWLRGAAIALVLGGCGGSGHATSATAGANAPAPRVSLNLKGGSSAALDLCGASHHYTSYSSGRRIEFAGKVTPAPSGRWKVKVKVKVCRTGSFKQLARVEATRAKHTGAYAGILPPLVRGAYYARAGLYVDGKQTARSDKRHLAVRSAER